VALLLQQRLQDVDLELQTAARLHDGTITVLAPDTLWVTDATEGWSVEGRSAVFAIIDHASGEAWCDASLRMDRFKTHE